MSAGVSLVVTDLDGTLWHTDDEVSPDVVAAVGELGRRGVLAVGDGSNDVELLAGAAVALVPAVAHPSALDRADHVIPAAADAGWTQVLDHV